MLQMLFTIISMALALSALYMAAHRHKSSGVNLAGLLYGLDLRLADLPEQAAFFMFSITAAIAMGVIAAFSHIASLWIISLDILFILAGFLLVKFHRLKLHPSVSL